ncbi:MAG TPA: hypothetical protein P5277_02475 [Candidatus Paceibacterota bacterium]|nr:hypothetical protein [Candidatus Paceibacterota bacterium]
MKTLYSELVNLEKENELLKTEGFDSDISNNAYTIFDQYKQNELLNNALNNVQTIEESVKELGEFVKPKSILLPWGFLPTGKNKIHNKRIKQLGELVTEPSHLYARGIFCPDNLLTISTYAAIGSIGLFKLLSYDSQDITSDIVSPEKLSLMKYNLNVMSSLGLFSLITLFGGGGVSLERSSGLPLNEARFIDKEIDKYYD